jgi:bisphosphoglycerate-independent phosphoglycerate mutase (AlkP superfamily)
VATTVIVPDLGGPTRWLAGALLRLGGVTRLLGGGSAPGQAVRALRRELDGNTARGFVVLYLNDADLAGHAWGWMSPAYLAAAGAMDRALAGLASLADDPATLLMVTADHGGGGVLQRDHDHPHPANETIPLMLAGGRVVPGGIGSGPVNLLDIPPTVLHGLGCTAPAEYEGRVLHEAFATEMVWA